MPFADGFSAGWTGGLEPAIMACPQFCVMGPFFHFLRETFGSDVLAVCATGMAETVISYSSQTRNAQMAFNQMMETMAEVGDAVSVPLAAPLLPWGPAVSVHIVRNIVALSGIRVFARPIVAVVRRILALLGISGLSDLAVGFLADFLASIGSSCISMPLNQLYNFAVTSKSYLEASGARERLAVAIGFLDETYLVRGEDGCFQGISAVVGRDLVLRCLYVATLFSLFATIERGAQFLWKRRKYQE